MAEIPLRSPVMQALYAQKVALDDVATTARHLSRWFGEPRSLERYHHYLAALEREQITRKAYSDALAARQAQEPQS